MKEPVCPNYSALKGFNSARGTNPENCNSVVKNFNRMNNIRVLSTFRICCFLKEKKRKKFDLSVHVELFVLHNEETVIHRAPSYDLLTLGRI